MTGLTTLHIFSSFAPGKCASIASAFLPREPHELNERQTSMATEDEAPRPAGVQHAAGEEQRNSSRKNEAGGTQRKPCPAVDVSGGESKVRCCKEQDCIGTWNVHESR